MTPRLFLAWLRSRTTAVVLIALLCCAAFQAFALGAGQFAGLDVSRGYALVNNSGFASFVLVPLFGFLSVRPSRIFLHAAVASACGSRRMLALRSALCSIQQAACYALAVNVMAVPLLFIRLQVSFDQLPVVVLASFVLQTLFFAVCGMLFFLVYAAVRTAALSYVAVLVYGLWDFMASNVVGGGLATVGWSHVYVELPLSFTKILGSFSFFAMLACLLVVATMLVTKRMSFLARRGS